MQDDNFKEGVHPVEALLKPLMEAGKSMEEIMRMMNEAKQNIEQADKNKDSAEKDEASKEGTEEKEQKEDASKEDGGKEEQDEKATEEEMKEANNELNDELANETDMENLTPEDKVAGDDLEAGAKKNADLAKQPPISAREQRDMDKEELKQAKKEYKEAKKELNQLHRDYEKEIAIMEMNVKGSPQYLEAKNNIDQMEKDIYNKTQKVIQLKEEYEKSKPSIQEEIKSFAKSTTERARIGMHKLDILKDRQINLGKQAICNIKNNVRNTNKRFQTKGLTAYNGLEEKVATTHRGYLARQYKYEKVEQQVTKGLRKGLEKTFTMANNLSNEAKSRLQNVGRALTGQQFQQATQKPLTPMQQKILNTLKGHEQELGKSMQELSVKYDKAIQNSLNKMMDIKHNRSMIGLGTNTSLDQRIQNAIQRAGIVNAEKKVQKVVPSKDTGAR